MFHLRRDLCSEKRVMYNLDKKLIQVNTGKNGLDYKLFWTWWAYLYYIYDRFKFQKQ